MKLYKLMFMACLGLIVSGCFIIFMALLPATKSWPNSLFLGFVYAFSLVPIALGGWRFKLGRNEQALTGSATSPRDVAGLVTSIALIVSGCCLFLMFLIAWQLFPKFYPLFPFNNIVFNLAFVLIGIAGFAFYTSMEKEGRAKHQDLGTGIALVITGCFFILVRLQSGPHHLTTGFELLTLGGAALLFTKLELITVARFKGSRFGGLIILAVVLAYVLWAFAVSWLGTNIVQNIMALMSGTQEAKKPDGLGTLMEMLLAASGLGHSLSEKLSLAFNFWALAGAAGLVVLRYNPWRLDRWARVTWGGLALGMLVGRPFVGWLSWAGKILPEEGLFTIFSYTVAPPLLMLLAGGFALQTALEMISWSMMESFAFCVALPVIMFNQLLQFDNTLKTYRQQQAGLVGYITRLGFWLRGEKMPDVPDDSKGARFATPQEITALYKPKGAAFGHVNGSPLFLENDKHTLIMASTRSGKGVSLIVPHLLRYTGSAFVLDPKGENARATGRHRATLNDTCHYLDPFGITGKPKSRFNPLSRFKPDNMEAASKELAAALVLGERDHWTASAQQLIAALILHVYTSQDIPPKEKDLPKVRRLLLRHMNATLGAMAKSTIADGLLASLAISFLDTPEKEFGSIVSTAQRETEILDNPFIIKCLSASGEGQEVDFSAWHKGTMTVYLCLSAPKFPVFSRWLRLVLTSALDEMTDTLNPPPLPVCFMLDELATLGHLSAVENAVGLAAGYGIQLVTVFQDVAQMRDLYKGRWASFIGNAGVRAIFNLDDYDTAKYWSNFIGGTHVATLSQQQDIYGITHGQTQGETIRPLLAPEELMLQFAGNVKGRDNGAEPAKEPPKMLVLAQGSRPIISKRVAYFHDRALDGLWDDPRQNIPSFDERKKKKEDSKPSMGGKPAGPTGSHSNDWEEKIVSLWISKRDDLQGFLEILDKSGIILGNMTDNGDYAFLTKDLNPVFILRKGSNQINNDLIQEMIIVFKKYYPYQPDLQAANDNMNAANDNELPSFDEFRKRKKKKK